MDPAQFSSTTPTPPINPILNQSTPLERLIHLEKKLLRLLSLILILHGLTVLYNELIHIFYVFPHIPKAYTNLNFSAQVYQAIFRQTVLISTIALLKTIYGLFIIKHHHLTNRIHLITALGILVASYTFTSLFPQINIVQLAQAPQPPTLENILRQRSLTHLVQLFTPSSLAK